MFAKYKIQVVAVTLIVCLQFVTTCLANCTINTSALSFGNYDFLSIANNNSTSQLSVLCDADIPYAIKMNAGVNAGGDFSQRNMRSAMGATPLHYNLYLDASYSQVWGDGRGLSSFYQGLSSGLPSNIPIYGRIPPRQNVSPGIYTDSVVITIEW